MMNNRGFQLPNGLIDSFLLEGLLVGACISAGRGFHSWCQGNKPTDLNTGGEGGAVALKRWALITPNTNHPFTPYEVGKRDAKMINIINENNHVFSSLSLIIYSYLDL